MARLSWPAGNYNRLTLFAVHRRSQSSTRENSSEPRFDFNTPAKSGGGYRQTGSRGQESGVHHSYRTPESESTHLTSRTPQNGSYSCKTYEW